MQGGKYVEGCCPYTLHPCDLLANTVACGCWVLFLLTKKKECWPFSHTCASGVRIQCWLRSFEHFTTFYSLMVYLLHYLEAAHASSVQESSLHLWMRTLELVMAWMLGILLVSFFQTIILQGSNAGFLLCEVFLVVKTMSGGWIFFQSLCRVMCPGKNDYVLEKLGCMISYDGKSFEISSGFCYFFVYLLQKNPKNNPPPIFLCWWERKVVI